MYTRYLDLKKEKKSVFLFGPRQTGKTELLKALFPQSPFYNLLLSDVFLRLTQRPQSLREDLSSRNLGGQPVIIDEIQKFPLLLDEVQYLIQDKKNRFILTGSSARKLKRGGANLLGGRARVRHLFPLVTFEIPRYDFLKILNYGALPSIYDSSEPELDLKDYVGNYLQEEIQAESLVRQIEGFSRFLQVASLCNGELVNYANVANDAAVKPRTVSEFFQILQDTLIGRLLEPFRKTKKRKAIVTAKFYFFDIGVTNILAGRKQIQPKSELFGKVLEHFIFTELCAWLSYRQDDRMLTYWRSTSGFEVDFLVGDEMAIEVKASDAVSERHLTGLKALGDERLGFKRKIVVSMDPQRRKMGDVEVIPVKDFLTELWAS